MTGNARDPGVLDPYADGFTAWLSARGYAPSTVGKQLTLMGPVMGGGSRASAFRWMPWMRMLPSVSPALSGLRGGRS